MDGIQALDSLSGRISAGTSLQGKLSESGALGGTVCVTQEYDAYTGDYEVVPQAFRTQTLETANKLLRNNIVVNEIPYFETGNDSNGMTAYIAKETN